MRVNQFWFPAATWVVETTSSLTPITPGTSRRIASASSIFKVPAPPQPVRMPLEVVLPEKIRITFLRFHLRLRAVANPDHCNDRADANDDPERGEHRAHLVSAQRPIGDVKCGCDSHFA